MPSALFKHISCPFTRGKSHGVKLSHYLETHIMRKDIIVHSFEGIVIQQRQTDGYLNATAMCKAYGKLFADYYRLDSTQAFLGALSSDRGTPISQLVISRKGNTSKFEQGTWVHPHIAKDLKRWLSLPNKDSAKLKGVEEHRIRNRLHRELGGNVEVDTPAGKIDLLTPSEVIEVKALKSWKTAIGQVIVYGRYYPHHQKRIHLFGKAGYSVLEVIDEHCGRLGITLTLEFVKEVPL